MSPGWCVTLTKADEDLLSFLNTVCLSTAWLSLDFELSEVDSKSHEEFPSFCFLSVPTVLVVDIFDSSCKQQECGYCQPGCATWLTINGLCTMKAEEQSVTVLRQNTHGGYEESGSFLYHLWSSENMINVFLSMSTLRLKNDIHAILY